MSSWSDRKGLTFPLGCKYHKKNNYVGLEKILPQEDKHSWGAVTVAWSLRKDEEDKKSFSFPEASAHQAHDPWTFASCSPGWVLRVRGDGSPQPQAHRKGLPPHTLKWILSCFAFPGSFPLAWLRDPLATSRVCLPCKTLCVLIPQRTSWSLWILSTIVKWQH